MKKKRRENKRLLKIEHVVETLMNMFSHEISLIRFFTADFFLSQIDESVRELSDRLNTLISQSWAKS